LVSPLTLEGENQQIIIKIVRFMKKAVFSILAITLFSCNTQKNIKADYEVNKNETFEVSLKANHTTGFSWKWIKNESSQLVDSVSVNYIPTKVDGEIAGSGGNEIWKFKANKSGLDTLKFEYCQPWDENSTVETKKVIVQIK
jgi:inhibitor of cysteine peptidase